MTILPDGRWRCVNLPGLPRAVRKGNANTLEQFPRETAAR
jgi:hypothetical protein